MGTRGVCVEGEGWTRVQRNLRVPWFRADLRNLFRNGFLVAALRSFTTSARVHVKAFFMKSLSYAPGCEVYLGTL